MDAQLKEGDGAFWISFDDFTDFFENVSVCMVRQPEREPHGNARKPWEESRKRFEFKMVDGEDGKEVTAPAFLLTLSGRAENVYVGVHQKDKRCVGASQYIDIGITILKVTSTLKQTIMRSDVFTHDYSCGGDATQGIRCHLMRAISSLSPIERIRSTAAPLLGTSFKRAL